jgi:hypothetical protein
VSRRTKARLLLKRKPFFSTSHNRVWLKITFRSGGSAAGGGVTVEYTCKEEYGAILHLNSSTTTQAIHDNKRIRDYVLKNYEKWSEFAQEELALVEAKKILFVRGWVKTSADWTATAFTRSGSRWKTSFNAEVGSAGSLGVEYMNKHAVEGPVVTRYGSVTRAQRKDDSIKDSQDQCVFLKYYSVKHRKWLPDKLEANADPHRLPDPAPDEAGTGVPMEYESSSEIIMDSDLAADVVSETFSTADNIVILGQNNTDPVDAILDYILEVSYSSLWGIISANFNSVL